MSLYHELAFNVLAPAMDLIRGTHTISCLRALEESQWWPLDRIQRLQAERLRRLIAHAYEHVPYYRGILQQQGLRPADIDSAADLVRLPILTKADIRAAGNEMLADSVDRSRLRPMSTSGSMGEPLRFYGTVEDQFSHGMARTFRALSWAGIRLGDRYATLSRPRHYPRRREQLLHQASLRVRRAVELDYSSLSEECLARLAHELRHGRFTSLGGSPPLLCLLADYMRDHGIEAPLLTTIVSFGEQLYPHERRRLRQTLGHEPYSKYGSFEVYDIACECDSHRGMHIQAEDVIVEIVDDSGTVQIDGRPGHVLLTNLHNYGLPFIRYDVGDVGTLDSNPCACGRRLPRLTGMVGRTSELLITRSGRRIFGDNIDFESFGQLGVRQFRLVQQEIDRVVAFIVWHPDIAPESRPELERRLAATLHRDIGDDIRVTVEAVARIEPSAAGKHTVVVSRLASRAPYNSNPPEEEN